MAVKPEQKRKAHKEIESGKNENDKMGNGENTKRQNLKSHYTTHQAGVVGVFGKVQEQRLQSECVKKRDKRSIGRRVSMWNYMWKDKEREEGVAGDLR